MRKQSFPPVIGLHCKFLILGSMPGEKSLAEQQYYAHPHNLFWPFMEELFGIQRVSPYDDRLYGLLKHHVALWDVMKHCHRQGSLDSQIRNETVNDFSVLLSQYQNIKKIGCNGKKAYKVFHKNIATVHPWLVKNIELVELPSTSPANASISRAVKLEKWRNFFKL